MMMQDWQLVLRRGLFPQLDDGQLARLGRMLEADDGGLVQGETAVSDDQWGSFGPDRTCTGACLIGVTHERFGDLLRPATVAEVEGHFADVTAVMEVKLPLLTDRLIGAFDHADRGTMLREFGAEVSSEIQRRNGGQGDVPRTRDAVPALAESAG